MTLFQAFGQFAGAGGGAAVVESAWQIVTPSSISNTGGTATINSSGSITMGGNTVLNVNGVFSATYDDYAFIFTGTTASTQMQELRLRASGTDASGTDYSVSGFNVASTSIQDRHAFRNIMRIGSDGPTVPNIHAGFIFHPFLATETTFRVHHGAVNDSGEVNLNEYAGMHTLTTSYDGFSWLSASATTGTLTVMGMKF